MFTGLIEELGTVKRREAYAGGERLVIAASKVTSDLADGDSIAVNGVCLTAREVETGSFAADVSPETLDRSTLGALDSGSRVNLERSVTLSTRLGGHMVQGHVDGRGTLVSAIAEGEFWTVKVGFPPDLARYLVHKGSVAVEGISLTIAALDDVSFDIAMIPKTWEMTNMCTLSHGAPVNLEVDVVAKYVERMMAFRG